ncbi:hypothetical protein [Roseovarius aestuarii]|uniref:Uncharacterized protein n=1 Tax=Roseovarius aestuarii TaxID=475083 RepID=A0A1X7BXJ1_9RHOB|nr:hypothetical protein [Roseovarius aestuarii]SMC14318.1 hypothetical protein ROA7745_04184 [Roseovarius aestuarii]
MSKWLAIAEQGEDNLNSLTDNRQELAETPFLPVSAVCRDRKLEKSRAENLRKPNLEEALAPKNDPMISIRTDGSDYPNGTSPGGRPVTYTGKVVSLDAWRRLSEWEKHGPDGWQWNGKTQNWEVPS